MSDTLLLDLSSVTLPIEEAKRRIANGASVDRVHPETGLPILHIFVGYNNVPLVKLLIEHGVNFGPDRFGRWPSAIAAIAAICEVSEEMCDLVVEAEAAWLEQHDTID